MPNPEVIVCPQNAWVLVAENVITGTIYKLSSKPGNYLQTIRITGELAPINNSDGALLFGESSHENIESTFAIDVYVKAISENGKVRVDI